MLSGDTNTKQKTHYGLCESPPEAFALLLQHLSFQVVVYPGPVCSREGAAVTSASCPRQDVTAAGLLQFVQVSTASGTERRGFFVSLTSTIQTMQRVSLDLFPMSQRFLSSPFPCHEPRTSPANPGHVHLSATVQILVLCSHSHQGSQGPLCPLYSCRSKGWNKKMWNYTAIAVNSPLKSPYITVWSARPSLQD